MRHQHEKGPSRESGPGPCLSTAVGGDVVIEVDVEGFLLDTKEIWVGCCRILITHDQQDRHNRSTHAFLS